MLLRPPAGRRTRLRRWIAALGLALPLVLTGCGAGGGNNTFTFVSPGGQNAFSYPSGQRQTVGDLSGPSLMDDGDRIVGMSDYADRVVVLNVWGSWCAPCRAEAPDLTSAARDLAPLGVQFIGIDVRDTRAGGRDFHTSFDVPYPSIFDPSMRTLLSLRGFPTSSIPSTIVLDREHRVAQIWLRRITATELTATVRAIATEAA